MSLARFEAVVGPRPPPDLAPTGADEAAAIAALARATVAAECRAVMGLAGRIDAAFVAAVQLMHACSGHVVVTGVGKSGIIGAKISATLASVGVPSYALHAAEAVHGDLGRLRADDVLLALSFSGESSEVVRMLRPAARRGARVVALTGRKGSTLARAADAVIWTGELSEACPMGLVPTASTTAMLVLGDALALALGQLGGLDHEIYAQLHPGGSLGRRLMRVGDVMRAGVQNPVVSVAATLREVLGVMDRTPGRPGAAILVDAGGKLAGLFTDGDLRRLLARAALCIDGPVAEVMCRSPKTIGPEARVDAAAALLEAARVDQLPVVDSANRPVGLLDVQDILAARA